LKEIETEDKGKRVNTEEREGIHIVREGERENESKGRMEKEGR